MATASLTLRRGVRRRGRLGRLFLFLNRLPPFFGPASDQVPLIVSPVLAGLAWIVPRALAACGTEIVEVPVGERTDLLTLCAFGRNGI